MKKKITRFFGNIAKIILWLVVLVIGSAIIGTTARLIFHDYVIGIIVSCFFGGMYGALVMYPFAEKLLGK